MKILRSMNGFEAYWVKRACEHWVDILRSKLVFIFCGNFTAVRGFIHGGSASPTVCRIVSRTWQCWIENQITSWIEWVHTKSTQRILSHALDGSQRLNGLALRSMRSSGSAIVQRTSSRYCQAATFHGSSGPQILKFSGQCPYSAFVCMIQCVRRQQG